MDVLSVKTIPLQPSRKRVRLCTPPPLPALVVSVLPARMAAFTVVAAAVWMPEPELDWFASSQAVDRMVIASEANEAGKVWDVLAAPRLATVPFVVTL